MTRPPANAPNVGGSPKPGQFTIRGLLIVTFCLAVLLTVYVRIPKWMYLNMQMGVMSAFSVLMFSGLIFAVVDFFKRNRGPD
jgi:hypothetical protein